MCVSQQWEMCHEPRAFANMWGSCKCSFKEGDTDLSPERYKSVEWNVEPDAVTEALSGILSARHWWFKQTCGLEAGREKKREKKENDETASQAFQQTAYVPLRRVFHLGLGSANRSDQQRGKQMTLTRTCQMNPQRMVHPVLLVTRTLALATPVGNWVIAESWF